MKKVTPIKYLMNSIKGSILGIKKIFKKPIMLLPGIIVSIIWGILSYIVATGNDTSIVYILSIITFAQGGMYAGVVGAIGGIIGKGILATFVTKLFIKKEKIEKEKVKGNSFIAWMLGIGLGLIIYNFLSGNASLENAVIGITVLVTIIKSKKDTKGFWYGFLSTFSKNIEKGTVKSILTGMSVGLIGGIVISCIKVDGNFIPYIVGATFIILSILGKIITKPKRVLATVAVLLIFVCNVTPIFAETLPPKEDKAGMKFDYKFSGVTIESQKDRENDYTYNNNPNISREIKGTCTNGEIKLTIQFYNNWDLYASVNVSAYSPFSGDSDKDKKIKYTEKNFSEIAGKTMTFTYPVTENDRYVQFYITLASDYYILDGKILKSVDTLNSDFLYAEILTGTVCLKCEFENLDSKKEKITTKQEQEDKIDEDNEIDEDDEEDIDDEWEKYLEEHASKEETIAISVAAYVAALLSIILGGTGPINLGGNTVDLDNDSGNNDPDEDAYIPPEEDEYITIKNPASGAETMYKRNQETGDWISIDGFSQLDPSRLEDWYKQRESDRKWMDEQNEKTRLAGGSATFRETLEQKEKDDKELAQMIKDADEREKNRKDEWMKYLAEERDYNAKVAARYSRIGDMFRAGEITATGVSVVADGAVDVYGHVNPSFARGYKIAKATLAGAAEDGWAGATKGAINGVTDAALVGTKINFKSKAFVRFGSRVVSNTVSSAMKGENASQIANSMVNGAVDGLIHAGTGATMDKLTGNLPKFKINTFPSVNNPVCIKHINASTVKKIFGTEHGGAQRILTRGIRDFAVKPLAKKIKRK